MLDFIKHLLARKSETDYVDDPIEQAQRILRPFRQLWDQHVSSPGSIPAPILSQLTHYAGQLEALRSPLRAKLSNPGPVGERSSRYQARVESALGRFWDLQLRIALREMAKLREGIHARGLEHADLEKRRLVALKQVRALRRSARGSRAHEQAMNQALQVQRALELDQEPIDEATLRQWLEIIIHAAEFVAIRSDAGLGQRVDEARKLFFTLTQRFCSLREDRARLLAQGPMPEHAEALSAALIEAERLLRYVVDRVAGVSELMTKSAEARLAVHHALAQQLGDIVNRGQRAAQTVGMGSEFESELAV